MWPPVPIVVTIIITLQMQGGAAQLGNRTHSPEDILDIYEPPPLYTRGNLTRIEGGKPISISQAPWQAAISRNGQFICGGSIITKHWVLTAAHCLVKGGYFLVRAGSPYRSRGGQVSYASFIYVNSNYNPNTMNYDIGLIRVDESFDWSYWVQPVRLANAQRALPYRLFVTGWGSLRPNGQTSAVLRGVTIRKVNRSVCQNKFAGTKILITGQMICAAAPSRDSCQGDSGGALVNRGVQYGIVSFGIGCGNAAFPGVYTNVRKQRQWIDRILLLHDRTDNHPLWG